ncbi:MAG: hypothetical protein AMJ46_10990 [Latescibacteria bacterium DG_63]|nr:MAG: hypothetical protein AMJ46_10990 [Latescibacteria bacterium DG_63]
MARPKAKIRTKAKGKSRVKVRKRKKPTKTPKARARRKTRRPAKMTPEKLLRELTKLRKAVSTLQRSLADVPDKKVIIRAPKVREPIGGCREPGPIIIQPLNAQCYIVGQSVKAILFKRCIGGIGFTLDFLIEIIKRSRRG